MPLDDAMRPLEHLAGDVAVVLMRAAEDHLRELAAAAGHLGVDVGDALGERGLGGRPKQRLGRAADVGGHVGSPA